MADKKNGAPAGKRPRDVAGDHALAELLDRLLGAALGFAEAGVIVGLLVYFLKNWGLSVLTRAL